MLLRVIWCRFMKKQFIWYFPIIYCSCLQASCSNLLRVLGGEWGSIDHVIVGSSRGAHVPDEVPQMLRAVLPEGKTLKYILENPGNPFDPKLLSQAERELEGFIAKLNSMGIKTSQPIVDDQFFSNPIVEKEFRIKSGLYAAMPRDGLLLLPPNLVVLSPMAWRSRQRESAAFSEVLESLKQSGLRVVQAPRPSLSDGSYVSDWHDTGDDKFQSVITEKEPLFDAADFIRFGSDIVGQLSHVTNQKGVEWIRSVLDKKYRLHIIEPNDTHPMHIDATILPLGAGKLLVHPERVPKELQQILQRSLFKDWQMLEAPYPNSGPRKAPLYFTSPWINMNMLVGSGWSFVEENDITMIDFLKRHQVEAIPMPFQHFQCLGGSFHCATVDIRWRKTEESVLHVGADLHIYMDQESGTYRVKRLFE